jgi:hypothetical protein
VGGADADGDPDALPTMHLFDLHHVKENFKKHTVELNDQESKTAVMATFDWMSQAPNTLVFEKMAAAVAVDLREAKEDKFLQKVKPILANKYPFFQGAAGENAGTRLALDNLDLHALR